MHRSHALAALAGALTLLNGSLPQPRPAAPQDPPDSIFVTAAHGDALVPLRVVVPRHAVLAASGTGTWSGDTLTTRTPLVLELRATAAAVTLRTTPERYAVRVTLAAEKPGEIETRTGSELVLRGGAQGWAVSARR